MDAVQYVKDKTGAPPCADDEHQQNTEDCQKQMWEWSVRNTCAAATSAAGSVAGVFCENGGALLAKYTWPLVKNIMMPLGEALQDGIMAVIPNSWEAHGVFCPDCEVAAWFTGQTGSFEPSADGPGGPYGAWLKATQAVETAWTESLKMAHLPPDTPFEVYSSLLIPQDPADRFVPNPNPKPGERIHPGNVTVKLQDGRVVIPEKVTDPESALLLWMDQYVKGTRTIRSFNHDRGFVANSITPGRVLDYNTYDKAEWGYGIRGRGPFGLQLWKWADDCSSDEDCFKEFNRLVNICWGYRLAALQRALPEVVGAVFAQVASMAPGADTITFRENAINARNQSLDRMSRDADEGSTAGTVFKWALALGLLGAGGYGAYRWHKAKRAGR